MFAIYICVCVVLFFHLSVVLYFEKNASVDNQCFGFQLLLTNHPKHSGLKCLFICFCLFFSLMGLSILLVSLAGVSLAGWQVG